MQVRFVTELSEVDAKAWDALVGDDDPFVEHAFLSLLEESGSVGGRSGWAPVHVTAWEGEKLVAALPLYAKDHSYGEYIFDWAWASAAARLGVPYYPKLVSMVPLTPATGRRLLVHPDLAPEVGAAALVEGALAAARELSASSVHFNFLAENERDLLASNPRLMPRLTQQFHFHNAGYRTFDDFLGAMRAPSRKQVKRERRRVAESGLEVRVMEGRELGAREWKALHRFYKDTCAKKGSFPYLTKAWFSLLPERLAHRVVAAIAYDHGAPVAGTLNFEKGGCLYGRYWGCDADYAMLHFELCYYRLIERTIDRGMQRFEAGAQGFHKLKRGLVPSPVHSAHFVEHPVLAAAIADHLPREAHAVISEMEELDVHGPFRRDREEDEA